jgi:BioD-like phosphotransacetylase family protein
VIEGSGHAAVGHNLGLSNGFLASLMNAQMLLVTSGALAHPVDELALNKTFLEQWGVPLAGVIINRVKESDQDLIDSYTRPVLDDLGIELLGTIPEIPDLARPTMLEVREELDAEVFCGHQHLSSRHRRVVLGAMTAAEVVTRLDQKGAGVLLVTPGDRSDVIIAALSSHQRRIAEGDARGILTGAVITGGITPHPTAYLLLQESGLPVLFSQEDSFRAATRINAIVARITASDRPKVQQIIELVARHVNIERLMARLAS